MKSSEMTEEICSCHIISTNELVTLYHGSKSGIHGAIAPVSRERCDLTDIC